VFQAHRFGTRRINESLGKIVYGFVCVQVSYDVHCVIAVTENSFRASERSNGISVGVLNGLTLSVPN
jgi:hypothetical protein